MDSTWGSLICGHVTLSAQDLYNFFIFFLIFYFLKYVRTTWEVCTMYVYSNLQLLADNTNGCVYLATEITEILHMFYTFFCGVF